MVKIKAYWYLVIMLFVFFSCQKDNTPPIAEFSVSPSTGSTLTVFSMDAGLSYDDDDKISELKVRWDWNNDNDPDTDWTYEKTINLSFSIAGEYIITLEVRDKSGLVGTKLKFLNVIQGNYPPEIPQYIKPILNSNDNEYNFKLSWICSDYEDDILTYNIYFGNDPEPRLIETGWNFNYYPTNTLLPDENYYWKIVAHDEYGNETEGPVWYFETKGDTAKSFTDTRDGNTYRIVNLGNQWWLAENLRYVTSIGSVCYDLLDDNCLRYGRLYNWEASLTACPQDWHLPSDNEWKELEKSLGMHEDEADFYGLRGIFEGQKLKSTAEWINNGNGTNESGFSAMPAGQRSFVADFNQMGESASFWSSTYFSDWESWAREIGRASCRERV